jgi:hypothetical protein
MGSWVGKNPTATLAPVSASADFVAQVTAAAASQPDAACDEGLTYLRRIKPTSIADGWARSPRANWMLFVAAILKVELDRHTVVAFAVECSDRVLPWAAAVEPNEPFRQMVGATRRWLEGKAVPTRDVRSEWEEVCTLGGIAFGSGEYAVASGLFAVASAQAAHLTAQAATPGVATEPLPLPYDRVRDGARRRARRPRQEGRGALASRAAARADP